MEDDLQLEVRRGDNLPTTVQITAFLPWSSTRTTEQVLKILQASNPVNSENWAVRSYTPEGKEGMLLRALIDQDERDSIRKLEGTLRYGFTKIQIHGLAS